MAPMSVVRNVLATATIRLLTKNLTFSLFSTAR